MQNSYTNRLLSFKKSLENLKSAKTADKDNYIILSGVIMIYNLTFDLAWKLIKDVLIDVYGISDFPSGSPKETLKKAESVDLIDNNIWIDMLNDRNELMHDYDYNVATEKYDRIVNHYLLIFEKLLEKVENIDSK